jgi:hypothetical protein
MEPSPVEQAEREALRRQLGLQQEQSAAQQAPQQQEPQPPAPAPQPQLPAAVREWISAHPEFMNDRERNLEIQLAHHRVLQRVGSIQAAEYLPTLERALGIGNSEAPVRTAELVRENASARPVRSAPVSREGTSFSGHRPSGPREPLSAAEQEAAKLSGVSPDEYRKQRERMLALKATGQLQS